MNLLLFCQAQQSPSIWEKVLPIILAFIGSGIVTYCFERHRTKKKEKILRHLIESEIRMNLEILDSKYVHETPWITHKTWSAFYDANSNEVTSFNKKEISEKIMRFYAHLELLALRNVDDQELERLRKQSTPDVAQSFQLMIGKGREDIRNTLIQLGKDILGAKS